MKTQFNNKILALIALFSIALAYVLPSIFPTLEFRWGHIFGISIFVCLMIYNVVLVLKEKKDKPETNTDKPETEKTDTNKTSDSKN